MKISRVARDQILLCPVLLGQAIEKTRQKGGVSQNLGGTKMKDKLEEKKTKKRFFSRMFEKLDKKMEEKAKSVPCCNRQNNSGKDSCCS